VSGGLHLGNYSTDDIFPDDFALAIAKKPLGKFIKEGYFAEGVHSENNAVRIIRQRAMILLAFFKRLLESLNFGAVSFHSSPLYTIVSHLFSSLLDIRFRLR
jgi:hypothetical protein